MFTSAALAAALLASAQPAKAPPFELKDGDRVVWVGGTLVEREQRYGYWETALHVAYPKATFTLRNLGWSGDTVRGEARGRFDFNNPDVCFRQLVDQTLALKPTVIFVSYGTNESFEGEAGLPAFRKGLEKLLDALAPAKARTMLFTPVPFEPGPGVADPKALNAQLATYARVVYEVADSRGLWFADLFGALTEHHRKSRGARFTDNGMHLSGDGYRATIPNLLAALGQPDPGQNWDRLEPLRQAVVAKNELFFHRWRPQNETYLFGFRKHEQGKNAKEVAEFDPLVAKAEDEIAAIKKTLLK